ncbi:hypothetical protein [Dokdonella soli]|uniref:Uncharacterized protein n=1 Tax=Dokdonella soli TaxID=529810 RepID=A0ABP3TJW6_9GAMM
MKRILLLLFVFILGILGGGFSALWIAQGASKAWAIDAKLLLAQKFRFHAVDAYRLNDWERVQFFYEASNNIAMSDSKGAWSLDFPLYAWSISSIVNDKENLHGLVDESIIALAMERQGKVDEATLKFGDLEKKFPGRTREQLTKIADTTLKTVATEEAGAK